MWWVDIALLLDHTWQYGLDHILFQPISSIGAPGTWHLIVEGYCLILPCWLSKSWLKIKTFQHIAIFYNTFMHYFPDWGAKHRRQYELSSGISLFNYVITATFMFLSPCIATRFRLYLQPKKNWLSGSRVGIIVSATHPLVVEPSHNFLTLSWAWLRIDSTRAKRDLKNGAL